MNVRITFTAGPSRADAGRAAERVRGLLLHEGERCVVTSTMSSGGLLAVTLPATRAAEFCAELVAEGFAD